MQARNAMKGSQYCLQRWVKTAQQELDLRIITASPALLASGVRGFIWKSPIAEDDYREYRDDFLTPLGLQDYNQQLRMFWPEKGPQWDGLAIAEGSKRLCLLVEAKSHPGEMKSSSKAPDPTSLATIRSALNRAQGYMGAEFTDWAEPYYQLANRLAFTYFMNEFVGVPTFLVLLNFVNDETHKSTDLMTWQRHYAEVFESLGIDLRARMLDRLVIVFPPAHPTATPKEEELS